MKYFILFERNGKYRVNPLGEFENPKAARIIARRLGYSLFMDGYDDHVMDENDLNELIYAAQNAKLVRLT